jgi:uncharacterized GH25 family protein
VKIKKSLLATVTSVGILLGVSTQAFAHDGWSQTNTPIVAPGNNSYVEMLFGNHSNEHKSYRIDGHWNPDTTKVYVTLPNGAKQDITKTMFYTGEEKEVSDATLGVNNSYISSFSSNYIGAHIVSVEGDSIFKHGDVASRTLRSAKSFVAVADIPMASRVRSLTGFSKQVTPDRAEIIPLFNPVAVQPNQQLKVQVLLKGKPFANADLTVIQRSNSQSAVVKTDRNGVASFKVGAADYYLLRVKIDTNEKVEGKYDKTSYEATMTMSVQNQSFIVPTGKAKAFEFYVNGKKVPTPVTKKVKNVVYVPADFIHNYVNKNVKGGKNFVPLVKTVNNAGYTIDTLSQVGDFAPEYVIYKKK